MILMNFFTSVEFYVIMAVIAAAVVAFAARPQARGEVMEFLLASRLVQTGGEDISEPPTLQFACLDTGRVRLTRRGLAGVSMSGAVSIAASFDGVNLSVEERVTPGNKYDLPASSAIFDIGFLPAGRYHVRYNSDATGLFAAFQLHVRSGIVAERALSM